MTYTKLAHLMLTACVAAGIALPGVAVAATKKNKRDSMTTEQKAKVRREAREWCRKKYANNGQTRVDRVAIGSDGRVTCYLLTGQ
jgi:hypothetical protein